ncbi:hypothetical protein TD95_002096 [Thielaviopsis punctulata]|uniref:TOG domain-containing protein n=1 Tax=Thielaviopsis punctulata TaxID=72032 RepID=A0A0F4ZAN0_9PEZI|nr:hypothetical protein TD95_002096 [Thielaviopsis punctulata]
MSVLPAEVSAELSQLLQALQSADNSVRAPAEEHLLNNWTLNRPEVLLMGLAEQVQMSPDATTRSFGAVIFRRICSKSRKNAAGENIDMFYSLASDQAAAVRAKILEALASETQRAVRNKISDAVAEIARQYTANGDSWPELLSVLFQLSLATEADKRETAFRVFAATPAIIEKEHEQAIAGVFSKGFKDEAISVRLAAVDAFASFFSGLNRKTQTKFFSLIPDILNILPPIKESGDSDDLSKALLSLIELAEHSPKMFKPLFHNVVVFCISVVQEKELEPNCRQNALELLATFADYAPSMCRKDESYTNDMITQCLSLMTDLGDDDDIEEWLESEDLDQNGSDQNHVAGEQTMDRLANKLGGETILAPTFNWLPRMVNSPNWKDRHAALMAISAISEGCRELMIGELRQVLNLVIPALTDPHPRVRWAGCNALGQMSTDFAPKMQSDYSDCVLTAIIPVLDSPEPRVKSHAAAALVNFCEESEKETLEPYLDDLLSRLFNLLQDKRYVQEQALSTIATIADAAESTFGKYYDNLMPTLVNVLRGENHKDVRLLRAKAMECATLIALAVGKERLGSDAQTLVQLLSTIQNGIEDDDDPQEQYLMHCWGRMCRVLDTDFLPFLPTVIPPLLELASAKADITLIEDEDHIQQMQHEEGWDLVPVKGKMVGIRTSIMEDKRMAIELLVVYAQVLEQNFAPYVPEVMKIALPGLAFFFHDPVRFVSSKLVPALLNSCKKAYGPTSSEMANLWAPTLDKLLGVLVAEPAVDTLAEMYQGFYESVEVVGPNCMVSAHMERFIENATSALDDYKERVKQRIEDREDGTNEADDDESDELLMAIEDDQTLLSDMNKAFHAIFKNHGTAFLPAWERLMDLYTDFLASNDATQRQWALCIFDDVLEYCGEQSTRYASLISQPLIAGCQDPSAAIRQAAAYGIGVIAQRSGAAWTQFLVGAIPALLQVSKFPDPRSEENVYATENACAALAKILHFCPAAVGDAQAVVDQWIVTLPVVNDDEAAPYAYSFLAELIDKNNSAVTSRAGEVFLWVAQALEAEMLQGEALKRVVASTKALCTAANLDPSPLMTQFTADAQARIMTHFS